MARKDHHIGKKLPHAVAAEEADKVSILIEDELTPGAGGRHLVFRSEAMRRICAVAGQVAGSDASVLIYGESGTGKELLARFIHRLSGRRGHPFVPVNCGVLQGELFADRFFGHEAGAFTGAQGRRRGAFESAGSGTLFLDEVGEIPSSNQTDFLRVLEERCFRRMGGEKDLPFQARIIAATNRPLMNMVRGGGFRGDLFYRLNVVPVSLPPLRERPEDVVPLAEHLLAIFRLRYHRPELALHEHVLELFHKHHWPGNVRELRNLLERLVLLAEEPVIGLEHMPPDMYAPQAQEKARPPEATHAASTAQPAGAEPGDLRLEAAVREAEIRAILRAYGHAGRHKGETARLLGVSPRTLRYKLAEYGLDI